MTAWSREIEETYELLKMQTAKMVDGPLEMTRSLHRKLRKAARIMVQNRRFPALARWRRVRNARRVSRG